LLSGKRILLIIGGGIAAYKSLELIRLIRQRGGKVRCIVTAAGRHFVTPLSVASLSGERVYEDLFSLTDEAEMGHIQLSRDADLLVVSDGEFSCPEASLLQLDAVRARHGLRVQGVLVGDRETIGLLEVCDAIHWVRDWRRHDTDPNVARTDGHSPVHSKSLTALYFPGALSERAKRAFTGP
jgi:hypothetical protein